MKICKTLSLILICAALVACGTAPTDEITPPSSVETSGQSGDAAGEETEPSSITEESEAETEADTPAAVTDTIEESVLLDQNGVKITAKSLDKSGWMGPELKLLIENSTEKNLTVQVRDASVNGYMISTSMSEDVSAGKKANGEITFSSASLEAAGISTFADMEFSFHISDEEWETYLNSDMITVRTAAADTYTQAYDDSGVEVFNSNGIRVVSKGLNSGDIFGTGVVFYAHNDTDATVIISDRDCSVNGFMIDPDLYMEIAPGKHAVDDMDFFASQLEENDIADITDVEFSLHIYNSDTWDDIANSDPIILHFD